MHKTSFKDLKVWQKSIFLVKEIYVVTTQFDRGDFSLVNQMRRAAVSIPSNIAEGKKRKTKTEFLQFLRISDGSAAELETQLIIAKGIYPKINFKPVENMLLEVQKMLLGLIRALRG